MNNLEQAADLLENNWCTGAVKDGDKYCAVGALAYSILGEGNLINLVYKDGKYDEHEVYVFLDGTEEAKVLASTILERAAGIPWIEECGKTWFNRGEYSEIIMGFNDRQKTVEPVLEMFKYAAKEM